MPMQCGWLFMTIRRFVVFWIFLLINLLVCGPEISATVILEVIRMFVIVINSMMVMIRKVTLVHLTSGCF